MTFDEVGFDRADPGASISPYRTHEHEAEMLDKGTASGSQPGSFGLELSPPQVLLSMPHDAKLPVGT